MVIPVCRVRYRNNDFIAQTSFQLVVRGSFLMMYSSDLWGFFGLGLRVFLVCPVIY